MSWDIAVAVLLAAVMLGSAYLGVRVTLHPVESDASRKAHKAAFWTLGAIAVALIAVQTARNTKTQANLQSELDRIERNTKEPPKVQVNMPPITVPPPTVIFGGPSTATKDQAGPPKVSSFLYIVPTGFREVEGRQVVALAVNHRGPGSVLNNRMMFYDSGASFKHLMNSPGHSLSGKDAERDMLIEDLPEVDTISGWGIGRPPPSFQWSLDEPDHAEFSVAFSCREGYFIEILYLRKTGITWGAAIRVEGMEHKLLLYCRDPGVVPSATYFNEDLPSCADALKLTV